MWNKWNVTLCVFMISFLSRLWDKIQLLGLEHLKEDFDIWEQDRIPGQDSNVKGASFPYR